MTENNRKVEEIAESFKTVEIPAEVDLVIEKAIQKGKKHRGNSRKALGTIAAMLVISTFVGLNYSSLIGKGSNSSKSDAKQSDVAVDNTSIKELPKVENIENLKKLLKESSGLAVDMGRGVKEDLVIGNSAEKNYSVSRESTNNSGSNHSDTNVQVDGVDEGDIVKTDGEYIYKIRYNTKDNSGVVDIIKAYPVEAAAKVSTFTVKGRPSDLYIKDDYLIILSNGGYNVDADLPDGKKVVADKIDQYYGYSGTMSVQVVSKKDESNPKLLRETTVEGNMLSSRLIDNRLYLVTNKYINTGLLYKEDSKNQVLPTYWDSANGGKRETLSLDKIGYCPEVVAPNYIIVSSLNLKDLDEKLKVTANLGSGNQVYSSEKNLYVSGYSINQRSGFLSDIIGTPKMVPEEVNTAVYKFNLKDGEVVFQISAEVPGNVINQFSMDEYGEEFRIATTRNYQSTSGKYVMDNNLYILDGDMKLKGKIENIAEGERIYSTRFMGKRAYMVTFKNVDPLFVIDVSDGKNPKILGQLKIPGFSNYLHPYDENHIIGFGLDTELMGAGTESERAMSKGMKMAIFDVSDVNNPKEKFVTIIGDRGTYSELLYNHKALLFDKEKELLALPVQVAQHSNGKTAGYYQGAYIYKINLTEGFKLREKISHLDKESQAPKNYYYDWNDEVQRILYIEDYLYTLSNDKMMIHSIDDLEKVGEVSY